MTALWTSDEIVAATGGTLHGPAFEASGVSFDSREVEPGWLFVAMPGTVHDGHGFVARARAAGAVAALVSQPVDGPHVLVDDVVAALEALAVAARARMTGRVVGITGSVGKTSTKEAVFAALDRISHGAAHRSLKSYNNHTGVPLSLARLPRDAAFAVLEMGMNHAGEIAALTRLVRPHVALVTTIASAHIENLGSMEAIADAKAEIFEGLEPGGIAIIPEDSLYRDRLARAAARHAEATLTFGGRGADVRQSHAVRTADGSSMVRAVTPTASVTFTIALRGDHWVANALSVLAVVEALDSDRAVTGLALAELSGLKGRGERHRVALPGGGDYLLIDESYNANPASMAATLKSLGEESATRRIAVLGPMRELGKRGPEMHAGLALPLQAAQVEVAILLGDEMAPLAEALGDEVTVVRVDDVDGATHALAAAVRPGDAVLVKASNSIGLATLVATMAGA